MPTRSGIGCDDITSGGRNTLETYRSPTAVRQFCETDGPRAARSKLHRAGERPASDRKRVTLGKRIIIIIVVPINRHSSVTRSNGRRIGLNRFHEDFSTCRFSCITFNTNTPPEDALPERLHSRFSNYSWIPYICIYNNNIYTYCSTNVYIKNI